MARLDAQRTRAYIADALDAHERMLGALPDMAEDIARAADLIATSLADGGQVLLCGNGGSAADAQHIAAELTGRFQRERDGWPAQALHANTSVLTSIANDYGFDEVFARQVRASGKLGDVLVAISTSGDSPNVLKAIEAARDKHLGVIGLTGPSGGVMGGACDVILKVPGDSTPRIQEGHILVGHIICGLVEEALA